MSLHPSQKAGRKHKSFSWGGGGREGGDHNISHEAFCVSTVRNLRNCRGPFAKDRLKTNRAFAEQDEIGKASIGHESKTIDPNQRTQGFDVRNAVFASHSGLCREQPHVVKGDDSVC